MTGQLCLHKASDPQSNARLKRLSGIIPPSAGDARSDYTTHVNSVLTILEI